MASVIPQNARVPALTVAIAGGVQPPAAAALPVTAAASKGVVACTPLHTAIGPEAPGAHCWHSAITAQCSSNIRRGWPNKLSENLGAAQPDPNYLLPETALPREAALSAAVGRRAPANDTEVETGMTCFCSSGR